MVKNHSISEVELKTVIISIEKGGKSTKEQMIHVTSTSTLGAVYISRHTPCLVHTLNCEVHNNGHSKQVH